MIAHLRGEVAGIGDKWAVIDVGGVGYFVQAPLPVLQALREQAGKVRLYTHMTVREDGITLYGFASAEDLELFRALIGVSGIGPQIGLSILSHMSVEDVVLAIIREDEKALTAVPGIGQKSARRLILELSEKMEKIRKALPEGSRRRQEDASGDAISVLISLGFPEKEARTAVQAAAGTIPGAGTETLVKAALSHIRGR